MDGVKKGFEPSFLIRFIPIVITFVLAINYSFASTAKTTLTTKADQSVSAFDVFEGGEFNSGAFSFGIGEEAAAAEKIGVDYSNIFVGLLVLIGVLVLIIFLLAFVAINMGNLIRIREGEEPRGFSETIVAAIQLLKNRYVIVFGNLAVVIIALTVLVDMATGWRYLLPGAQGTGLHQDYQPVQPIKFSHKLHAGENKIDCGYCHTGAYKGKNAWIPSTNVCMNCHKAIKEGPKYGKTEIAKVVKHHEEGRPIEWVRIHNLPDHAYFNHSQHVVVGKQECQTCHGPVEEMEEVYQYSRLSMGWCVNCHRDTELPNKDIYEVLYQDKDKNLNDGIDSTFVEDHIVTVEDIGGTNCARCHY